MVYSHDETNGVRALRHVQRVVPRIEETLGCEAKAPEVWLLEQPTIQGRDGLHATSEDGEFLLIAGATGPSFEYLLTHELAHWGSNACGVALPMVVEEGLADVVASRVMPSLTALLLAQRKRGGESGTWSLEQALRLDFETWSLLQAGQEAELRAMGFTIVMNLGLECLEELREEARVRGLDHVPAEWFLGQGPGAAYPRLRSGARDLPVRR